MFKFEKGMVRYASKDFFAMGKLVPSSDLTNMILNARVEEVSSGRWVKRGEKVSYLEDPMQCWNSRQNVLVGDCEVLNIDVPTMSNIFRKTPIREVL
jgi:hypothetical protein